MNRTDNSLNFITLAIVLALTVAAAGSAMAKDRNAANLLWPQNSFDVAQSTRALAIGREVRAIKRAERALAKVQGHDRVVALYNVCLGYLRQGDMQNADPNCDAALTAAIAYTNANDHAAPLHKIVAANIDRERGKAQHMRSLAQANP